MASLPKLTNSIYKRLNSIRGLVPQYQFATLIHAVIANHIDFRNSILWTLSGNVNVMGVDNSELMSRKDKIQLSLL